MNPRMAETMGEPMSDKQQNLQDTFLNAVRKSKSAVTIFLINHPRAALAQPAIDALLLWIAQGEGRSTERQNSN